MEKIEQIENLKNSQVKIAKQLGLERLINRPDLSVKEMEDRCMYQIFGLLKQEISSHLSSIDSLFTASIVLEEPELTCDICKFLDDFCIQLADFIADSSSLDEEDEEGGDNEIS